jgi:DNA-binding CsgD family transcriptional regulator
MSFDRFSFLAAGVVLPRDAGKGNRWENLRMAAHAPRILLIDFINASLPRCRSPSAVLIALADYADQFGIAVLGAWDMPRYFREPIKMWRSGETIFFHPGVAAGFWSGYQLEFAKHGFSALSLRGRDASVPFTMAEAARDIKKRRPCEADWIFEYFRSHNFRDCLYCTFRKWAVVYVSATLLALTPATRHLLAAAGMAATGRIESLLGQAIPYRRKARRSGPLTEREQQILQHRAVMGNAAIAKLLGLSVATVDTHLQSARAKLKATDTTLAVTEALRRGLIEL